MKRSTDSKQNLINTLFTDLEVKQTKKRHIHIIDYAHTTFLKDGRRLHSCITPTCSHFILFKPLFVNDIGERITEDIAVRRAIKRGKK